MPSLHQFVLLVVCCVALPLAAQESGRSFVVPPDRAYTAFAPQAPPTGQEKLQNLVGSFGAQSPPRPTPIQPVSHTTDRTSAESAVISADMGRNDVAHIPSAAVIPRPFLESMPIEPVTDDGEDIAPGKLSVLDAPLVRNGSPNAEGKMAKPLISGGVGPVVTMFASLFLVITTFLILALLFRKVSPKGSRPLPRELFENLGRAPLTQKFQLHLLRLGNRLILVSVTLDGVQPITEITDPDEVVQLLGLCRRLDANSSSENFKKIFNSLAVEPTQGGYFGTDVDSRPKPRTKATPKSSLVDLYSESHESLTELLANGLKGGRHG